ncbi:RNA 2',3'-cyclic phosphodiesterase [Salisaeta longa]|uniref:RNA 2',3'-cyclic phosphodiesterase n=1 Tax=Salisaeta longa TaxID=503170 RepID=UPI0003B46FC0|nr:RNA 2',3'-cyclic phosphodiesterase [Salisaeta longa]
MRLFVALDLPGTLRTAAAAHRHPDAVPGRWVDPAQYHVTLAFIGAATDDERAAYGEALAQIGAPPARLVPYGLDALPSRRAPRVLTVGLERTESLVAVHTAVTDALAACGVSPDDRPFRPHITLARLNDPDARAVHRFIRAQAAAWPAATVSALTLYRSTRTADGARYDAVTTHPLGP